MNQAIDNLDGGGDATARVAHPEPNLAAQRNQVPVVVVIVDDRLLRRMILRAIVGNLRRIDVNEG